jgi:hypothetical protein
MFPYPWQLMKCTDRFAPTPDVSPVEGEEFNLLALACERIIRENPGTAAQASGILV